ncbi:hypothetical protein [Mesorhizobium sp. IMUNJ 23232]|uniref:hypothetical protein n=1 Tax=Mesorhizobium sp. IMUNJ 23232 TaxID=3376064 RepID=UPI0037B598E3
MKRASRYGAQATGFLSAVLLYLAAALAGAYGPLTTEASSASRSAAGGMDARDPQSAQANHKRPSVSFETRELNAAATPDGGNAKATLPPNGPLLPEYFADARTFSAAFHAERSPVPHGYSARAPPTLS